MNAVPSSLHRIFANMLHLMSGKAVAGILSLAYIALAARMLGVAEYGVLNLVHGYAVFVGGVVAFSGFHAVVSYGADALKKAENGQGGQHQRLHNLIRLVALVELGMAILAIAIAVFLVPLAGMQMGWSAPALQFGPLYCLAIFATVRATPQGILQLAGRFDLIGLHQAVMPITRFIGVLFIWFTGGGLTAFLWVWLVSSLAEGVSMWIMAYFAMRKMDLDKANATTLSNVREDNPGLIKFMAVTNFDITLRELAPRATPLIIGWILGPAATGLYTLVQRATMILYQPAQMLGQAGYSVFAKAIAAGDLNDAEHSVRRSVLITLALSAAIASIFAIFGRQILTIMGGAEFASGGVLLFLVAAGRALLSGTPTLSSAITALGRPGDSVRAGLIVNLGTLPLLPPLLWWLGINGAGWHVIMQSAILAVLLGLAFRTSMIKAKAVRVSGQ
jgi:O-antigen/teichoic acid export membrane protein